MYETEDQSPPLFCVIFAGRWMECQHHQCGDGGTQFRSVYCAEAGENNYIMYDDERCGGIRKPHVRLMFCLYILET